MKFLNFLSDVFLAITHPYDLIGIFIIGNALATRIDGRRPYQELDAAYPPNLRSVLKHAILLILSPILLLLYPIVTAVLPDPVIRPPSPEKPDRVHDKWFFINGIGADAQWLDQNCRYIEESFNVGVTGIYNRTYGVIMDVVESILQRDFDMTSCAVRQAAVVVKRALQNSQTTKVRLLSHSQGSIITYLVLKQLDRLSSSELAKLEVYTFANASRYFTDLDGRIKVIEHYANSDDPIPRIGILAHPEFPGNVFVNRAKAGHLFNAFYSLNAADYSLRTPNANPTLLALNTGAVTHLPVQLPRIFE